MSNQFPPPHHDPQADPQVNPHANPQAGLPTYTGPAQEPGYGFAPVPQSMPGNVRAAQIVLWVLAGLTVLGTVAIAAMGDAATAGAAFGVNICLFVAAGFAFTFKTAGHGIRVTCIVLTSVQIAFALGGAAGGNAGGLLPLLGSIAVVVLLSLGSAGAWFKRPRTP
ncbi:hypothetical protein [Streptomyces sp. NPDC059009]|uniref:hypothetical protein n=1 Tax=Streptomyces sp. NPDC059009 TaxID=3346694 RepID=UPI00368ECD85